MNIPRASQLYVNPVRAYAPSQQHSLHYLSCLVKGLGGNAEGEAFCVLHIQ